MPIVYPLQTSGVSIVGQAIIRSPLDRTSADGYFAGAVTKAFHVDRANPQATAGLQVQVSVRLNFSARTLEARSNAGGGWQPWEDVISW